MDHETETAIDELRKAYNCLYIEVPACIADDVKTRAERVIACIEKPSLAPAPYDR